MGRQDSYLVDPLNELQKRILDLFGFSHDIYLRLSYQFSKSRSRVLAQAGSARYSTTPLRDVVAELAADLLSLEMDILTLVRPHNKARLIQPNQRKMERII
jgi:hypothetical protein